MRKKVKNVKVDVKTVIEQIYGNVQKALDGLAVVKTSRLENIRLLDSINPAWETVRTFHPEKAQGTEMECLINNIRLGIQAIGVSGATGKDADNSHDEWYQIKLAKKKALAKQAAQAAQAAQAEAGEPTGEKETRAKKALVMEDVRFQLERGLAHMTYCAVHPEAAQCPADTDKELSELIRRALNRMKELKVDLPPRARKAK